jgi:hypothetical protein
MGSTSVPAAQGRMAASGSVLARARRSSAFLLCRLLCLCCLLLPLASRVPFRVHPVPSRGWCSRGAPGQGGQQRQGFLRWPQAVASTIKAACSANIAASVSSVSCWRVNSRCLAGTPLQSILVLSAGCVHGSTTRCIHISHRHPDSPPACGTSPSSRTWSYLLVNSIELSYRVRISRGSRGSTVR